MSYYYHSYAKIEDLIGKTITKIDINHNKDEIKFYCSDNKVYLMYHEQDCCEDVRIEDVCGDIETLIGSPIIMSEEIDSKYEEPLDDWDESFTWTFYKLATINGYVTIRWYGESNGYYSEEVDFAEIEEY